MCRQQQHYYFCFVVRLPGIYHNSGGVMRTQNLHGGFYNYETSKNFMKKLQGIVSTVLLSADYAESTWGLKEIWKCLCVPACLRSLSDHSDTVGLLLQS